MKRRRSATLGILITTGALASGQSLVVGFEDAYGLSPSATEYAGGGAYYNGADGNGGFMSNGVTFGNLYNADWGSWSGWAWSTTTDATTSGFDNQFSAFSGGAGSGSAYGVAYLDGFSNMNPLYIDLPADWQAPLSMAVTNTTYTALTIRDGDGFGFANPFGQGDYFRLTVQGLTGDGVVAGTVIHYLADFRGDAATHTIQDDWQYINLSSLGGGIAQLSLQLESTDVGSFGINTPTYIAVDNLILRASPIPEPGALATVLGLFAIGAVLWRRR